MTVINFTPARTNPPFTFTATLDGAQYNCVVTWLVFGQYWYITISDLSNNLILYRRLVGSECGFNIQSLSWSNGYVDITTTAPHGYLRKSTIQLRVSGCTPDAFNGIVSAYVIDTVTLQYPLILNPGTPTALGLVNYDINIVGGYFQTSTLVFRPVNNQFEILP